MRGSRYSYGVICPDCRRPIRTRAKRGRCESCYVTARRRGEFETQAARTLDQWIADAVRRADGCLIWPGYTERNGYGRINQLGLDEKWAHRAVYVHKVGPIPEGHELDHLCHTRAWECPGGDGCVHRPCIDVDHLEPVTKRENWARGRSWCARAQGRPVCGHGHDLSGDNFARDRRGKFYCRQCNRERAAARYARDRGGVALG